MLSSTPPTPDDHEPASDEELAQRVRSGDRQAFEPLVRRHGRTVRDLVARNAGLELVDELSQEAFVAAFVALPRYRPTGSFRSWLRTIALRVCVDHWRRTPRVACLPLEADPPAPERDGEDHELLRRTLEQLGSEDREVVTLLYLEGLSVRDCAEVLSWSEAKVKVRAHRARKRLRALLERQDPDRGAGR